APLDSALSPSISQIAGVPSLFCHRMSALVSKLKSPVALICQVGPGLNDPAAPVDVAVKPCISQIAGVPSLFCHRMSDLPSPSKSPSSLICQLGGGLEGNGANGPAAPTDEAVKPPDINQIAGAPLLLWNRMSLMLLPVKSSGFTMTAAVPCMPH